MWFGWFSFSLCMCICVSTSVYKCMCANGIAVPNGVRVFKRKNYTQIARWNDAYTTPVSLAGIKVDWRPNPFRMLSYDIFFHPFDRCASCLSALRAWVWDILMLKRVIFDRHIQWSKLHLSTACLAALLSVFALIWWNWKYAVIWCRGLYVSLVRASQLINVMEN